MEDYEILVEATIKSIFLDAENKSLTLDLDCSWGKKDRKRLIVSGVDDFSLTNMRIQNIFDHIKIYDSKKLLTEKVNISKELCYLLFETQVNITDARQTILNEKLNLIQNDSHKLMVIEALYGADILILAKNYELVNI